MSMILIRGAPGSGKTTLANSIKTSEGTKGLSVFHVEADDYFLSPDGKYVFRQKAVCQAHNWCLSRAVSRIGSYDLVLVSNCFTYGDHMALYIEAAEKKGVDVLVATCTGQHRNVHGVPGQIVDQMRENADSLSVLKTRFPNVVFI